MSQINSSVQILPEPFMRPHTSADEDQVVKNLCCKITSLDKTLEIWVWLHSPIIPILLRERERVGWGWGGGVGFGVGIESYKQD